MPCYKILNLATGEYVDGDCSYKDKEIRKCFHNYEEAFEYLESIVIYKRHYYPNNKLGSIKEHYEIVEITKCLFPVGLE